MTENLFEAQYDITKKTRLRRFYDSKKNLIFFSIFLFIIFLSSFSFYIENKEKNKILLSENYVNAKIALENGDNIKALELLKQTFFS